MGYFLVGYNILEQDTKRALRMKSEQAYIKMSTTILIV